MSRLTPKVAKSRSRLAGVAMAAIPLASLPVPQRRLISALLVAAKAAALSRALGADREVVAPGETIGGRASGGR
jgi:hypothetical protein